MQSKTIGHGLFARLPVACFWAACLTATFVLAACGYDSALAPSSSSSTPPGSAAATSTPRRGAIRDGAAPGDPTAVRATLVALADGEMGLVRDAAQYAKDVGVSYEEAIRRLKLDRLAGKLATTLETNESDTLAGVWLQHKPEFRVIVAFTRDGERTIRPYIDGGPLEDVVEVRRADATRVELLAADEETVRIMRRLQLPFYIETNLHRNRVMLQVTDRERLESELREARERMPEHVEVVEVRRLPVGGVSSP